MLGEGGKPFKSRSGQSISLSWLLDVKYADLVNDLGREPHRLCGYLYQVATALSVFYEECPVLTAAGDVRTSRLALCLATRRVLATGLGLLGITAPDRM